MSFATGVIGGSGTNVWKPDPTLTPGVDGDPFAPFELGLTVTLDDRSFQVAQFCRIGAAGLLIDDTAAIVDGVSTTATEENFWTNKTGVDLVEGDYAFLFGTIINGAAGGGGGGTVGPATTNQVAYFTGVTVVGGDAGFTYNASTDTVTLVTALDVPLITHTVTGGAANVNVVATAITTGDAHANTTAISDDGDARGDTTVTVNGDGTAYSLEEVSVIGTGNIFMTRAATASTGDVSNILTTYTAGNSYININAYSTTTGNADTDCEAIASSGNASSSNSSQTTTGNAECSNVAQTVTGNAITSISSSAGAHHVGVSAFCSSGGTMSLEIDAGDDYGEAGDILCATGNFNSVFAKPIIASGVPSGAPDPGELPFAVDTTAVTGGFYVWNAGGSAWIKVSAIP